jgi:hypothetical protein
MRRAARTDNNQKEIVEALRKIGCCVLPTHQLKNAFDLLVGFRGRLYIMEIKDGSKPPSARVLTDGEIECKKKFESVGVNYHVINSVDEAIELVTLN